jgi:hypothetical protein
LISRIAGIEPSGFGWEATRRIVPPGDVSQSLVTAWDWLGKKIATRRLAFARH